MAIKELSNVQVKSGNDWYKLCPFPVGYIYISYTNTSPAITYGGTWSSISGGKYLRAAAASSTGGSNTISVDQMPSHTHTLSSRGEYAQDSPIALYRTNAQEGGLWRLWSTNTGGQVATVYIKNTGGGASFYPTYQNVYVWRRTA